MWVTVRELKAENISHSGDINVHVQQFSIILSFKYMYVMSKNGQCDRNMQHVLTRLITVVIVNVICLSGLNCNTNLCNQKHPIALSMLIAWLPMKGKKNSPFQYQLPHVI
jgi:hypothetical protein